MPETSAVYTLVTPGPDITFNSGTDIYRITNIAGLDMATLRTPIDDAPVTDGGIVHGFFYGPRHIGFEGLLLPADMTVTTRNTMEANLISALESIIRADGTLSWTPTGGSLRSFAVRCAVPVQFPPWQDAFPLHKRFIFGLVAADPTW